MKAILARLVSFVCYHIGDAVSSVMCKLDWGFLYPVYNNLMFYSSDIEKWAGIQYIWSPVDRDEEAA